LKSWGIESKVLYPYLDEGFLSRPYLKKKDIILTVGRFFTHLHAKKHDRIIKLFKKNKEKFPGFKLILAGGLKKENENYLNSLKKLAGRDPDINFQTNLSYNQLLNLYKKSRIYWHFAGFGIDEKKNPHLVEHFGITPLEAQAAGCIPLVYAAGGPKEMIKNGVNGFLFRQEKDLISLTSRVIQDENLQEKIKKNAKDFITRNFNYSAFSKKVKEVIL
jgi:glycosyltransferase involved in cell wall biosynthesis